MPQQEPRTLEEAMARKNIGKLKDLAIRIGCSPRSLTSWINGSHQPSPYYLGRMSTVLGADAREFFKEHAGEAPTLSRRIFVTGLATLPIATSLLSLKTHIGLPAEILNGFALITQQYRLMQRNGVFGIEEGLRGHIATIQGALEMTIDDRSRRELWRVLAQTQLLARLNITKESELGRAKTWNEAAVASAFQSGDRELMGATIGHLAHLHLMWQKDANTAAELLTEAKAYTGMTSPLHGWLDIVFASVAAHVGNQKDCEASIEAALETADNLSVSATDAYFTDFSLEGTQAFAGNSLLLVGKPESAYERLIHINLAHMAHNRHASTFYDISRAYSLAGELEAAQTYALQAIDSALATNRLYIIPRFITLSNAIQEHVRNDRHARAIAEYAYAALQQR